eukprot:scaffold2450_cov311-Chaetoceros_neogracile.AAC.2
MLIGLHRLLNVGNTSQTKSRSIYNTTLKGPSIQTREISNKQLSDSVESILGATYLLDETGCMAAGFLNVIGPWLPDVEEMNKSLCDPPKDWFAGKGSCMLNGYPFNEHSEWATELSKVQGILQQNRYTISALQSKAEAFCQLLTQQSKCEDQIKILQLDPTASLLLHCALFDDSIDDQECNPDTAGLDCFATLRDKLFSVGNAALQLSIVSESYHLFPMSTSGDIHLMKGVLISHDSLAYICMKTRVHECLFDTNVNATFLMRDYIDESDEVGWKEWSMRGGWIVPGGQDEFQKRIQRCRNDIHFQMERPQYMGLTAGRLWGHKKKLPDEASNNLQFCIVGALVLAFGRKDACDMIRPFFLDLMLVSPDVLRDYYMNASDLVSKYEKGKK